MRPVQVLHGRIAQHCSPHVMHGRVRRGESCSMPPPRTIQPEAKRPSHESLAARGCWVKTVRALGGWAPIGFFRGRVKTVSARANITAAAAAATAVVEAAAAAAAFPTTRIFRPRHVSPRRQSTQL